MSNRSEKMANWPMGKLIYSMSIPAVFSMLVQALYNIVDTVYISMYSERALFAMGLVFPLQMISVAIAIGGAIGTSTLIARRLGEKRKEEAALTATTGLVLTLFHGVFVALIGIFSSRAFLSLFTKEIDVINMGYDYLIVVMGLSIGMMLEIYFERIQQSQGDMVSPMISQSLGAITNVILDPIFIFGYFGIPEMGIKGAAIATVIGQFVAMIYIIIANVYGKSEIKVSFKGFKLVWERCKAIYELGLPNAIMNMMGSITTTAMNSVLVGFSDTAVTALSIYFKLQSFVFMPVFGFNQGTLPILSYNYGAQNYERFKKAVRIYGLTTFSIMLCGTLLFWLGTGWLLNIFSPSDHLIEIGSVTLKIISLSFPIAAIVIAMTTIFQSVGKSFSSMFMSLSRQLIFLIPAAFLFGKIWGLDGIWFAYPFAELSVLLLFLPKCIKIVKEGFNR